MSNKDILNKLKQQKDGESKPEVKTEVQSENREELKTEARASNNVTPEESVGDMLASLNAAQRRGNIQTGMASTGTGARMHSRTNRPNEPKLPGYYTLGWGVVRLTNRKVVKSTTLRGQFYYPLDSPAADFLEKRVGQGVTKVEAPTKE